MISLSASVQIPKLVFHGVSKAYMRDISEVATEATNKRIKDRHQTGDGAYLEPNRTAWANFKANQGFSTWPLVMTGQMQSDDAWEYQEYKDSAVARLDGENQAKWRNILDYADERATWGRAYNVGDQEMEAIELYIGATLDKQASEIVGVING